MKAIDCGLSNLLDLDGERIVIEETLGLWVKFEIKKVPITVRNNGVRYSFSLHDRHNKRILGFDNAHAIEFGGKKGVSPKRTHDHWHADEKDKGKPYEYKDASQLLEDFWMAVEKKVLKLKEI